MSSFKVPHEFIQVLLLCTYTEMHMHTDTQTDYKTSQCKQQNEWTMNHIHTVTHITKIFDSHSNLLWYTNTHYYIILSLTFANT